MKRPFLFLFLVASLPAFCNSRLVSSGQFREAIAAARVGDTLFIQKGDYHEGNLVVDKRLTIIGLNWPTLDGDGQNEVLTIGADGCSVSGLEIRNTGQSSLDDRAGIKIIGAADVTIENCRLSGCYFGIYLMNSQRIRVLKNEVEGRPDFEQNTGNGIHAWKCDSLRIEANEVRRCRDGIYFEFVTNSLIVNNLSEANLRYGLHFMFSHDDNYETNVFRKNGAGVAVMYTHGVTMRGNFFEENQGGSAYGLLLKDISGSRIFENHFAKNTVGIQMEGASRNEFSKNGFSENGWAVRLAASCDDNRFSENNFLGNSFDVATNGSLVLNSFDSNFWDKYDGYDLNRDGIGDVPNHPVSLFATVIEQMPFAAMLWRSFMVWLLDRAEKAMPSLTPDALRDDRPMMQPNRLNSEHPTSEALFFGLPDVQKKDA